MLSIGKDLQGGTENGLQKIFNHSIKINYQFVASLFCTTFATKPCYFTV